MVEGLLFVQKYDGHEGMCVVMFVLALCNLVMVHGVSVGIAVRAPIVSPNHLI